MTAVTGVQSQLNVDEAEAPATRRAQDPMKERMFWDHVTMSAIWNKLILFELSQ